MRTTISKQEYYDLGGADNELLAKTWTERGWRYYRSFDAH